MHQSFVLCLQNPDSAPIPIVEDEEVWRHVAQLDVLAIEEPVVVVKEQNRPQIMVRFTSPN